MKVKKRRTEKEEEATSAELVQAVAPILASPKSDNDSAIAVTAKTHSNRQTLQMLAATMGLKNESVAVGIIEEATDIQRAWTSCHTDDALKLAMATLREFKPETAMETMLAAQMIAIHHAAMTSLRRA